MLKLTAYIEEEAEVIEDEEAEAILIACIHILNLRNERKILNVSSVTIIHVHGNFSLRGK